MFNIIICQNGRYQQVIPVPGLFNAFLQLTYNFIADSHNECFFRFFQTIQKKTIFWHHQANREKTKSKAITETMNKFKVQVVNIQKRFKVIEENYLRTNQTRYNIKRRK